MFSFQPGRAPSRASYERHAARLEALAADLRRLGEGVAPTAADLASAPLLERWRETDVALTRLVGLCSGHPLLPNGPVSTTEVWVLNAADGWARTLSRYYRLGEPAPRRDRHDA